MKSTVSLFRLSLLNNIIRRNVSNESSSSIDFETAKSRLESSSIETDNETKLKLYGLYKQSTVGICSTPKPGLTDFVGRAKWTAWSSLGKLSQQDAQKQYIQTVQQLISSSPSKIEEPTNEKSSEGVELIKKSPLHWELILNRPSKYNAITQPMYERIIEILDQAGQDKQLVLLSLTGKGKFYSAGTDLADFAKMATSTTTDLKASVERGQIMLQTFIGKFIDFPKILIGFINGPAVGISVSTLGLFDGVYASSHATFSLPFTRTAQSAEGCSSLTFPSLMGSLHAKEILLFDRKLTAEEAQQRGLVTRVIDEKQFQEEKEKICQQILSLPKGSLLMSKLLIQKWTKDTLHRVNKEEVELLKQHKNEFSPSLLKDEQSSSSNERYYFGPSRLLTKRIHLKPNDGTLDFTITGGNHSQTIQIASVVWNSQAYLQGMRPGDQIISVNGIQFQNEINYTQVLQILYSMRELDIVIRTLRVNALDATLYDWYNPIQQRPTSPPPSTYLSMNAQLPYFERTVTIKVEKGKRLGLIIRGGSEYGLGMFISGVDKGSLSDQSGLCIGDQILSVNGIDFRHITHTDAVQLLRNINEMSFHLRQINKLPKPKDLIKPTISKTPEMISKSPKIISKSTHLNNSKTNFVNLILNEDEKLKLKSFLREYLEEKIHIDQLIKYLLEILNKQNQQYRYEIIESIRKFVRPNDFDRFDIYILKDDLNTLKFSHERLMKHSLSPSRMLVHSPMNNMSKSVENLTKKNAQSLIRPQSLLFEEQKPKRLENFSPNKLNSLRKSQSLHNVDQDEQILFLNKSKTNLTNEQINIIDHFLKDYSTPYPITIHKVRSTLGVAIEGGFQDRIPLPRIVYMQPDGCAYVSSGLRVGHVIIGLNGYSMKGLLHREAALFIASSFKDKNSSHMDLLVVEPLNDEQ